MYIYSAAEHSIGHTRTAERATNALITALSRPIAWLAGQAHVIRLQCRSERSGRARRPAIGALRPE